MLIYKPFTHFESTVMLIAYPTLELIWNISLTAQRNTLVFDLCCINCINPFTPKSQAIFKTGGQNLEFNFGKTNSIT